MKRWETAQIWHLEPRPGPLPSADDANAGAGVILDLRGVAEPWHGRDAVRNPLQAGALTGALTCRIGLPGDDMRCEHEIALALSLGAGSVMVEAHTAAAVEKLSTLLRVEEVVSGRNTGTTGIVTLIGADPAALFSAAAIATASPRVNALALDVAAISRRLTAPEGSAGLVTAAGLTLLAAAAADIPAYAMLPDAPTGASAQPRAEAFQQGFDGVISPASENQPDPAKRF